MPRTPPIRAILHGIEIDSPRPLLEAIARLLPARFTYLARRKTSRRLREVASGLARGLGAFTSETVIVTAAGSMRAGFLAALYHADRPLTNAELLGTLRQTGLDPGDCRLALLDADLAWHFVYPTHARRWIRAAHIADLVVRMRLSVEQRLAEEGKPSP